MLAKKSYKNQVTIFHMQITPPVSLDMTPNVYTSQMDIENSNFDKLINDANVLVTKLIIPKLNSPTENDSEYINRKKSFDENNGNNFQTLTKSISLNNFDVSALQITTILQSLILSLKNAKGQLNQLKLKNLISSNHNTSDLSRIDVEKNLQKQEFERVKTQLLLEKTQLINKLNLKDKKMKKYKKKIVEKNIEINRLARLLNENVIDNIQHDISSFDYSNSTISTSQYNTTQNQSINHSSNISTNQINHLNMDSYDNVISKTSNNLPTDRANKTNSINNSISIANTIIDHNFNRSNQNFDNKSTNGPDMLKTLGSLATQVLSDDAADTSINRTIILHSNSRIEDDTTEAEISFSVNNNNYDDNNNNSNNHNINSIMNNSNYNNIHSHNKLSNNNTITNTSDTSNNYNNKNNHNSNSNTSKFTPAPVSAIITSTKNDNLNEYNNRITNSRSNSIVIGNRLNTVPILSEIRKNVNNDILNNSFRTKSQLPRMGSFNTISSSFKD